MSRLDEAFAAVDDVHSCAEFEDASSDMSFQYLTLECLGTGGEAWAATLITFPGIPNGLKSARSDSISPLREEQPLKTLS